MKRGPISIRRIPFVLSLIVLPLTALVCVWNPSPPQPNGPTATSTPRRSQGDVLVDTPTPTGSAGNPLSRPTVTTTPDTSKYSLQISWQGTYIMPGGLLTVTYGPDMVTIPLGFQDGAYTGSYSGELHAAVTGICTATGAFPVKFDITAKKDGSGGLDFSVNRSLVVSWATVCPQASGGSNTTLPTITINLNLPDEDGASKTLSQAGPTWIYTLRKQGP
jgi:hypothetical protein